MKFNYCVSYNNSSFWKNFVFNIILTEEQCLNYCNSCGHSPDFMNIFHNNHVPEYTKIDILTNIILYFQNTNNSDVSINYKQKYEELTKLLEPHKLDSDMSPTATLKMILKYAK